MVKLDVIPNLSRMTAPSSNQAAAVVIAEMGGSGASSFYGLIGCLFLHLEQFKAAMSECRWNLKIDELCNNGTVITYKADARDTDGTEWRFILNQVGDYRLEVINARLIRANVDQESSEVLKDIKDVLISGE
jgi:hypothetical protein